MWHKLLLVGAERYLRREVRRRPPLPLTDLDVREVRRVLLLNATGLGDLLFSTPAIRALKETYPVWELEALVHPAFASLVAANPHLSRLWLYPGRGLGLVRLARELRARRFDLAVILHGNDPEATFLAWQSRAPVLVGSTASRLAFAFSAAVPASDPHEHAIERRLAYARLLGADTESRRMDLYLPEAEAVRAEAVLRQHFGEIPKLLLAFHPTGSGSYKWWPLENFAALGRELQERYQTPALIISGARDRAAAEALAAKLPGPTLVTGGRYPLSTVAALMKRARLLVANDSGPLHLALALGTPSIALIGADHPARIGPYRVDWGTYLYRKESVCPEERCLNRNCPNNRCMQAISVEDVLDMVETWWRPRFGAERTE